MDYFPTFQERRLLIKLLQHSDYYSQIDLEDLHLNDSSSGIALNLPNAQRFIDGLGGDTVGKASGKAKDAMDIDVSGLVALLLSLLSVLYSLFARRIVISQMLSQQ